MAAAPGEQWVEVADGVLVLRHDRAGVDVTTTAVVGPTGVVIVDALGDPASAARARDLLTDRVDVPVVALVSTHAHWDHTFGAVAFRSPPGAAVTTYAHHRFGEHLMEHEQGELAQGLAADHEADWADVVLARPDVEISAPTTIRPGGRTLVLLPLPPAHTTCDLVVHVPDAGVWVAGDVVEQSGEPSVEVDSDVVGWAGALLDLVARMADDAVVVPGHGAVVGRGFVVAQAATLGALAGHDPGPGTTTRDRPEGAVPRRGQG